MQAEDDVCNRECALPNLVTNLRAERAMDETSALQSA